MSEDMGASTDVDRAGRASHGAEVCPSSPPSGDHPLRDPVPIINKMLSEIRTKLERLRAQEDALCELIRRAA